MTTHFTLGISLLFSVSAFGQKKNAPDTIALIKVTSTFSAQSGKTYVDSIEMDMSKTYLDPDNVREIKTYKGRKTGFFSRAKGAILITRKKQVPFLSLADIKPDSVASIDTSWEAMYVIDGVPVDTTSVRLEGTAIKSVDMLRPAANAVLYHSTRKNVFVITTKSKKRREGF